MPIDRLSSKIISAIDSVPEIAGFGRVSRVLGMMVEIEGGEKFLTVGARCLLKPEHKDAVLCEVVGFEKDRALAMPFGSLTGIGPGCPAYLAEKSPLAYPDQSWLGRVVNALGDSIDDKGPLQRGGMPIDIKRKAPPANRRQRLGERMDVGVRALNTFLPSCKGQRMGIFAGSGVGKSVMMSMMARYATADVIVIGLIGERGREVQEFIEDDLGEEGLKKAVVVVATSDEPPLMRRQAAYMTLAVAEYFRDQGKEVLCLMDSVTRFAMAQREIGLSVGEPPTTKGYPPTTFAELAALLERAGPGPKGKGNITATFSVLVDGDDHNEPISDAVRGILDGHIVMDRKIADRGRYPAIDVLKSISRTVPNCLQGDEYEVLKAAKQVVTTYEDMEELIRLGAYRKGTDPKVDKAIDIYPHIEDFLAQVKSEKTSLPESFTRLREIVKPVMAQPAPPPKAPPQAEGEKQAPQA